MKLSTAIFAACVASIGSKKAAATLTSIDSAASRELKQLGAKSAKASTAANLSDAARLILDNSGCPDLSIVGQVCYEPDTGMREFLHGVAATGKVSHLPTAMGFDIGQCNQSMYCTAPDQPQAGREYRGTSETALLIEKGNYSFAFFLIYFSFVLSDPIDIDEVLARIAILGK